MKVEGNTVVMDEWDIVDAASKAVRRQAQNLTRGRKDAYGLKGAGWNEHLVGALGEAAVAMFYNVHWSGAIGDITAKDVGRIQVRTRSEAWHNLILHDRDPDDDYFILVHYDAPKFHLLGWIKAIDGKKPEFWKDPAGGRPAFFIPQDALNTDMSLLDSIIYATA